MTTETDGTDTKQAPRQRRPGVRQQEKARAEFEQRAQDWLAGRPGRRMSLPGDLRMIAALGIPCPRCGCLIYRLRDDDGHLVGWNPRVGGHWAAGITVASEICRKR